jgi:tetratricopeptide (TPR) repeat protein
MQTSFSSTDSPGQGLAETLPDDLSEEHLYACGHALHQQGRFAEATIVFLHLTMRFPFAGRHLHALAACLQAQSAYEPASRLHALCRSLEPANPLAAFHQGECRMQLGDREGAIADFREAARLADGLPQWAALAGRARGLADLVESGKES